MSLMPDIDRLLEADEKNVRSMQQFFQGYQGLSELLNEASILYSTCSRAFGQTLSHEFSRLPHETPSDGLVMEEILTRHYRALLFARIGVLYATAVADIFRMRLTAPLGYLRLQCESIALLKLMSENSSVARQWANIKTDKEGKSFFQKHQKRVMDILKAYDLSNTYDQTSGSALHSRFIGLALGYRATNREDGPRTTYEDRINAQEFDQNNSHRFMIIVIFTILRTQALIFANLRDAIPEINDPLLLETRFPQFIERVNNFMDRARKHFAQYYPTNAG